MNSRALIRHPGAECAKRIVSAHGIVTKQVVAFKAGTKLLSAVSSAMDEMRCDSGVMVLDGARLGPFNYVMPDKSRDNIHAAWYSSTYSCTTAKLRSATAIIGKREEHWWFHCHALWDSDRTEPGNNQSQSTGMGHLLPDDVTIAEDYEAIVYAFTHGYFDVQLDPETAFPLFHVQGGSSGGNAFIAKVYPHEDIYTAIEQLLIEAGYKDAFVLGIGSVVGCHFESDEPMLCPISEVLIGSTAIWSNEKLTLPMHCVDIMGQLFSGNVLKGCAPVTVTFELLVIER